MKRSAVGFPAFVTRSILLPALLVVGCNPHSSAPTAPSRESGGAAWRGGTAATNATLAKAIAAQERATRQWVGRGGIIGTGASLDEAGNPVVVVYAERAGAKVPADLDGVATRTLVTGPVMAYGKPASGVLQMGTSAGNDAECSSGTLGCVVVKNGVDYFLSNNHVFARQNAAAIGERIDAPGRYDSDCSQTPSCATLADFEPVRFGSENVNLIDAALARPVAGRSYTTVMVSGYDPSSIAVAPAVGMRVKKTGRSSRVTRGRIEAVNVTIMVGYRGGVALFGGQIQMPGQFLRPGDSGSLMVTDSGENPVGLCFAGSAAASFANPIQPVLQRFGVTVK